MDSGFLSDSVLTSATWQYLERAVARLLRHGGFTGVRVVGQTSDEGADVLAYKSGKRWLIQVKCRKAANVGVEVLDQTMNAAQVYRADVPVVATNQGFTEEARQQQLRLLAAGRPLQLWDRVHLRKSWERLPISLLSTPQPRKYQEHPVQVIVDRYESRNPNSALIIMATGLGKTFVAGEALRRLSVPRRESLKVLVLAHRNELVYQLERAFWPFLTKQTLTSIWNGYESADPSADFIFACVDSVANYVDNTGGLPKEYDVIVIDECHHAATSTYSTVVRATRCGEAGGPFLVGLTATPWRSDGTSLEGIFGEPAACIDIVQGLNNGWLSNVDYRMHVDNINWEELARVRSLTPRGLNRTLFIREWDDAVVLTLRETWYELTHPRAIVFCGTIDHAITMRDRINALGFTRAEALFSAGLGGPSVSPAQRNRILCDFHDGVVGVLCAVDILNEGIDLPDVNIVVFQRVTHSRRIFVQQLGRGLRLAEGKDKVIVLDFVSDIRRFAAGIDLQNQLGSGSPSYVSLGNQVRFMSVSGEDKQAEAFLREWLEDVAAVEAAGEDDNVLKFPPPLTGRRGE
jgi:superfamily II DNA or RNA helicase